MDCFLHAAGKAPRKVFPQETKHGMKVEVGADKIDGKSSGAATCHIHYRAQNRQRITTSKGTTWKSLMEAPFDKLTHPVASQRTFRFSGR